MRTKVWAAYLGAVAVVVALYYLLPGLGLANVPSQVVAYDTVSVSSFVAILLGIHLHRPSRRWPWLLLAVGQLGTGVGDVHADPAGMRRRGDRQRAASRHGVERVGDQVEQRHLQLSDVSLDRRQPLGDKYLRSNVGAG